MAPKRKEFQKKKRKIDKKSKKGHIKGVFSFLGIILMCGIFLFIGLLVYLFYSQLIVPTRQSAKPLSILLVGSDVSDFRDNYFLGTKPEKTDALMVLTFNPNTYTIDMTSIPRDTSVDYVCNSIQYLDGTPYTGNAYQDQINEVYQVSGNNIDCLQETVSNFLNVPIDYYVKVNMDQLSNIIDNIGGIDITVYAPDYYLSQENASMTNTYYWTDGEVTTMNGDEALTYARARHDSSKDYGRGIRQQQVVSAIASKVFSSGFDLDLITSLFEIVETDMPIKLVYDYYQYITDLKNVISKIESGENVSVSALPDSAWLNLYDVVGYEGDLFGTDKQRQKEVDGFTKYLNENQDQLDSVKAELISNYQFYNQKYSGHYNVEYEQLYEISNELRANLGLETEDVNMPSNQYGDNYAYGLMPKETTVVS